MKTGIIQRLAAACLQAACLLSLTVSCSDVINKKGKDGASLHLSIEREDDRTRTSFSAEESLFPGKVLLLFYKQEGILDFWREVDLEGLSEGTFDIGDIPVNREYLIYAIAGIDFTEDDVTRLFGTLQAAEAFTVSKSFLEQSNSIPLAFVPQGSIFVENGGCYEIPLRRLLAKYNFTIDASAMTGRFTATSLTVRQSPLFTRPLVIPNSASSPAALCDGDAATPDEVALLNESGIVTCYLLENCFGEVCPGNDDPWMKVPENMADGVGSLATYVEICGSYQGDNITINDLKYRFFLGEDATSDCDVRRNTVRTITLSLTDENTVLKESWKVVRGDVEDGRSLSFDRDSLPVFPYPTRVDTAFFDFSPANLTVRIALDSSRLSSYPFSVEREGGMLLIRSLRFIPQERTTAIFPIYVTTRDNTRRDTLNVAYYSLDEVAPYLPFALYTNFSGIVCNRYGTQEVLYKETARNRAYNGFCFKVDLNYNGIIKSCWSNIMAPDRDTVFETGLVLSSSDSDIISTALSPTNPTLWYLTANGLGTARITASYTMDSTVESGFSDVPAHILDISLLAEANIARGESCNPRVRLFNEQGNELYPYADEVHLSSSNTGVLTHSGTGVNNGAATLSVRYGYAYPYNTVTDSKEITVSGAQNTYELYIVPDGQQTIYAGESCSDTVRIRHWLDGELVSDEEAFGIWRISDRNIASIDSEYGETVTVTGRNGSPTPAVLSVTYYCEDGNVYHAQKNIFVMSREFFTDRESIVWNYSEYGTGAAQTVNVTATESLGWNVAISGPDAAQFAFSPASGIGSQSISVYPVSVNGSREANRTATLTLSAEGMESRIVTLLQLRDTTTVTPGPGPDPDPDPDPDPIVHDTTFVLTISPSGPQSISHHGTVQFAASRQMYVDSIATGAPEDVTAIAGWISSNTAAATVIGGLAQGCNYSAEPVTTTVSATLDGLSSNEVSLTVGGLIITRYLELRPSLPQSIEHDGTLTYSLLFHTVTDSVDDGGVDVTAAATWSSSNPSAAAVTAGVATGCNTSTEAASTTITAVYEGMEKQAVLTVGGVPVVIHTLEITTSQTIYYLNGEAYGQDIVVLYDGVPVTDATAVSWNISAASVIDGMRGFQPHFFGPGTCTVSASYGGLVSNSLNYGIGSLITKVRLEIASITVTGDGGGTWTGYIPPRIMRPGDAEYLNGETAEWCYVTGGTYEDVYVTITVNLYITTVGGAEQLASTREFSFPAMRGDILPFTEGDWPQLINDRFFTFNAKLMVE